MTNETWPGHRLTSLPVALARTRDRSMGQCTRLGVTEQHY